MTHDSQENVCEFLKFRAIQVILTFVGQNCGNLIFKVPKLVGVFTAKLLQVSA